LIDGELTVSSGDGASERVAAGGLFYWPSGHSVEGHRDADFVLFNPQHQHTPVLEHIGRTIAG
jgi:hypothetical protein